MFLLLKQSNAGISDPVLFPDLTQNSSSSSSSGQLRLRGPSCIRTRPPPSSAVFSLPGGGAELQPSPGLAKTALLGWGWGSEGGSWCSSLRPWLSGADLTREPQLGGLFASNLLSNTPAPPLLTSPKPQPQFSPSSKLSSQQAPRGPIC